MTETMLFPCSHGRDDPERATVPFIAATTAAVSGHRAVVICTADGAELGLPGVAGELGEEGLPDLEELMGQLVDSGGEIWICSVCAVKRGITEDQLIDGATIVGAAQIVQALSEGRAISLT